ncbi:response regulator [Nisaea acidiphila]|uniref:Sensory/regulatory protein RpfC n=1 Tax=Nisaea acidiphila TaxID=1862145 RepID=A0A9J7ALE0_9PROT|nr:response regulator [Nisaea acidiphila]UUX47983.1 response regulator [Nisaea acidiphila]
MKVRILALAPAAMIVAAAVGIGVFLSAEARRTHLAEIRIELTQDLTLLRTRLEGLITANVRLVGGMAAAVSADPDLTEERFARMGERIFTKRLQLRNIGAAPDLVLRYVYPLEGNEGAIGLDYRKNEVQRAAALKARDARDLVLAGPLKLVQGGLAVIGRYPVFVKEPDGKESFWGLVSAVIDMEELYAAAKIDRDPGKMAFDLAIRGRDGLGMDGAVFFGDETLFEGESVLQLVNLPVGEWVLAARPKGGWIVPSSVYWQILLPVMLIGLSIAVPVAGLGIYHERRRRDLQFLAAQEAVLVEAKEKATEAERQLRIALEAMNGAFVLYDRDMRFVLCNESFLELYPSTRRTMVPGRKLEDILRVAAYEGDVKEAAGREEEWVAMRLRQFHEPGPATEQELPDGRWVRIQDSKTPDGGFLSFRVDVTELKQRQEEAEAASRTKSAFLANMSHEIRTPLNGIVGLGRLLQRTQLDTAQKDFADKIVSSSQILLGIINDILDFSKIEAGQLEIDATDFNLRQVINQVGSLARDRADEKGLEFAIHIDPDTPLDLYGDPLRIAQILTNFCSNAVKFTKAGSVKLFVQPANLTERSVELDFRVEDTGIGMTAEQRDKIFKPFAQADVSTTRQYGGTGLGLSICLDLVERMGGRIWVESAFGKGSTFHASLPLTISSGPAHMSDLENAPFHDWRVLVVDDSETARLVLMGMVRSLGLEVQEAESGEAALDRIDKEHFDLIVLDWLMPNLDGIDTARRICEMIPEEGARPKIVLTTGASADGLTDEALKAGASGVLTKPFAQDRFLRLLNVLGADGALEEDADQPLAASLAGMKVLVAEDNAINQQVVEALLRRAGVEVELVGNGRLAVDAVSRAGPLGYDAVLMDIQMPEMDGIAATRAIREDLGFGDLPIVAATAHAMMSEIERCFEAGMNEHIAKPIDEDKLYDVLAGVRAGHFDQMVFEPEDKAESGRPETDAAAPDGKSEEFAPFARMKNLLGDDELAARLFNEFCRQNSRTAGRLGDLLAANDGAEAARLAHQVKGVAGNLGLTALSAAAAELETLLRDETRTGSILDPARVRFEEALEAALDGVRTCLLSKNLLEEDSFEA